MPLQLHLKVQRNSLQIHLITKSVLVLSFFALTFFNHKLSRNFQNIYIRFTFSVFWTVSLLTGVEVLWYLRIFQGEFANVFFSRFESTSSKYTNPPKTSAAVTWLITIKKEHSQVFSESTFQPLKAICERTHRQTHILVNIDREPVPHKCKIWRWIAA